MRIEACLRGQVAQRGLAVGFHAQSPFPGLRTNLSLHCDIL